MLRYLLECKSCGACHPILVASPGQNQNKVCSAMPQIVQRRRLIRFLCEKTVNIISVDVIPFRVIPLLPENSDDVGSQGFPPNCQDCLFLLNSRARGARFSSSFI